MCVCVREREREGGGGRELQRGFREEIEGEKEEGAE